MRQAVELLLKRMESNPDEFVSSHPRQPRWDNIIRKYENYMTNEERDEVRQKYSEIQMDTMHKDVMAELLYGEGQEELKFVTSTSTSMGQEQFRIDSNGNFGVGSIGTFRNPSGTVTITGAASPFTSSNFQLGKGSLDEETLTRLKALVK